MYLEELTNKIQLETDTVECKAKLNRDDVIGWLKTIAGFANTAGGDFYIGVEDKSNKLIGFDRIGADQERNYFNNQVNEHLVPRPQIKIAFLRYEVHEKERFILHVQVAESALKPVILKYKNVPSIFMRRNGFTNGATYEEIIEMSIKSQNTQYDVLPSDIQYNPENFTQLQNFYANHNNGKSLTDKALQSMGFYDADGMLANGAVLFEDGYTGGKTQAQCSVFAGFTKGSERIVTINRCSGNIISTINQMTGFVQQRMNHSLIKKEDGRINIDAYPARALFEGIINAVAHRDYFLDGTQIQIDLFRDRLEISSPGGFYRGEKLGKTYDLSGIISKRRNELITAILVSCNVMEAAGTGFDKIMEEYAQTDDTHRPYIFSESDHFTLVLPDLTYQAGVTGNSSPTLNFVPVPNSTKYDEPILSYCYNQARKAAEIAAHLGVSDSSYLRKNILENLVQNGYLEKSRQARAMYYKTIPDMVTVI